MLTFRQETKYMFPDGTTNGYGINATESGTGGFILMMTVDPANYNEEDECMVLFKGRLT